MSVGAVKDYAFPTKTHWRRRVWNEILKRTDGAHRTRPILYLAGQFDHDRPIAISKGVPQQNLIAVERDRRAAQALRTNGVPVIHAGLLDVLKSWPDHTPVAAIHADLCSGLEFDVLRMYALCARPAFRETVLAVNLQRGRDANFNFLRGSLRHHVCEVTEKHRGWQLLAASSGRVAHEWWNALPRPDRCRLLNFTFRVGGLHPIVVAASSIRKGMDPAFFSYRSGKLVMDTVVCSRLVIDGVLHGAATRTPADGRISRCIAARLAVRTRRAAKKWAA